ncbi:MAG: OmpA family protein [Bacteroidales bacterium]|nr:OmpA family protein [Bacteroidales bacterium]
MKRTLFILTLLLATLSVSAQNFARRGFALGADRDTLLYIIASPFDNWYITLGAGAQTFIGNELEASARQNKLNYNLKAEIGKWIIPDVAISLRFSYFEVDGQSKYGLQPFIDYTQDTPNENGYYPFHAHAAALMGYVILDWTNFLSGYEIGRRTHLHVFSPIGLGFSMLHGNQRNPRGEAIGAFRKNWELCYGGGLGFEYEVSQKLALCLNFEVMGSESTWDWSPYDNSYSRFDIMPSVTFGARFNLLKNVTKYNPHTKLSSREKVNHEFISFGTHKTVSTLSGRIDVLYNHLDSMQNLSDMRIQIDSSIIDSITTEINALQSQIDSIESSPYRSRPPANVIEELINLIPVDNIPATIVYFQLDKYDLDFNGRRRLQNFAKELSLMDDTVEFFIIGAADSVTGTIAHNQWLSERRCEVTYRALVNNYGADPNQLITVPVGGITEYEMEENNRMALVILRTSKTEEIIRRWTRWK